jgi:hypothetical protein
MHRIQRFGHFPAGFVVCPKKSAQILYDIIDVFVVLKYSEQDHPLDHTVKIRKQSALESSLLVFNLCACFGRNQSPVRRPVWLWHAASS